MIGTATSSLCGFSSEAWPPRLKMPTLYPVLPRLRVGIGSGRGVSADFASTVGSFGSVTDPKATAVIKPLDFRNERRLLWDFSDEGLRMISSNEDEGFSMTEVEHSFDAFLQGSSMIEFPHRH